MKSRFTHCSLAIFFLLSGYIATDTVLANEPITIAQSIWKRFSSSEGNFSILMPGTPQEDKQTVNTKTGTIEVHTFTVTRQQEEVKYTVSYTEYPEQYIELLHRNNLVEKALENGKNTAMQKANATLVSETEISLGSSLGREIHYKKPGDKIVKHRIYLVNKRLYQIIVETTKKREKYLTKSMADFFSSFNLTD